MAGPIDQILQAADKLHTKIPGLPAEALPEVTIYFKESWGSRTRIDYGSGMELNFLCWLSVSFEPLRLCTTEQISLCLDHLGILTEGDRVAIIMRVFWRFVS